MKPSVIRECRKVKASRKASLAKGKSPVLASVIPFPLDPTIARV
jgi:hypothetical protein